MCKKLLAVAVIVSVTGCANMSGVGPLELDGSEAVGITSVDERNLMQDRLIRQANHACGEYTLMIQERPRRESLGMLIVVAVLATWATASPDDLTTGLTAGAAGFTAVNQAVRESNPQDVQNVMQGIELTRAEMRANIEAVQQAALDRYTAEDAVADAIEYNDACNAASGRAASARATAEAAARF